MSGEVAQTAFLDDGRALLATFTAAGWATASIALGESRFAFAREDSNVSVDAGSGQAGTDGAALAEPAVQVLAPHVGTVTKVAEPGRSVDSGSWVASIEVLGEAFDILALHGGTVARVLANPGTLVEFGQVILEISR